MELNVSNKSFVSTRSGEERVSIIREINQLRNLVQKQIYKNKLLYNLLRQNDIDIHFQPYLTNIPRVKQLKNTTEIELQKDRLLSLHELLIEQLNELQKYQRRHQFKLQYLKADKKQYENDISNNYFYMRQIWIKNNQQTIGISTDSHLQKLNKIVAHLKNQTKKLFEQEKKQQSNCIDIADEFLKIPHYEALKQKYERLMMEKQDMRLIKIRQNDQNDEKQEYLEDILNQNGTLKQQIRQQKQKIKKLENLLINNQNKIQQLTDKVNKLTYEIEKKEKKTKMIFQNQKYELVLTSSFLLSPKLILETNRTIEQIKLFFLSNTNKFLQYKNIIVQKNQQIDKDLSDTTVPQSEITSKKSTKANRITNNSSRIDDIPVLKFNRISANSYIALNTGYISRKKQVGSNLGFYTKREQISERQQ